MGSIEIRTADDQSKGYTGMNLNADNVPMVVQALAGITDMVIAEPDAQPSGRIAEAQWTGMDTRSQPVTVFLWPDAPEPPVYSNPESDQEV